MFLLIIAVIIILNFFYNGMKARRCDTILKKYESWIINEKDEDIRVYKSELEDLMKQTGYGNNIIPIIENVGYGQLRTMNINPISQFPHRNSDIYILTTDALVASKGKFKRRSLYLFNPLNWIELIVFLPKHVASYLGADINGKNSKIISIIWWVIGTVITTMILNTYSAEISIYIKSIFTINK